MNIKYLGKYNRHLIFLYFCLDTKVPKSQEKNRQQPTGQPLAPDGIMRDKLPHFFPACPLADA